MRGARTALSFFSILPAGHRGGSLDDIAAAGLWLPLVGILLGSIEGAAAWGMEEVAGPSLTAALVVAIALVLTGFHHTDGLADVADAAMAGGDRARRLAVLKDKSCGTGAVAAIVLAYLISWAALSQVLTELRGPDVILVMIAVEVGARLALLWAAYAVEPSHEGSGAAFVRALRGWRGWTARTVSMIAMLPAVGAITTTKSNAIWQTPELITFIFAPLVVGILLRSLARRWFGGANGDVLGASVELGRAVILIGMAIIIFLGAA